MMVAQKTDLKIAVISQARMSSTRLPGKVLLSVSGHSLLEYHLQRLSESGFPVYVATSTQEVDDPIEKEVSRLGFGVFRGSEMDVLSRYYEAARFFDLDIVIRVTSDCPLVDGNLIREGVLHFLKNPVRSYLSNCLTRTYPRGFDFEIFSMKLLEEAHLLAKEPFEREHVTPYIYLGSRADVSLINHAYFEDKSRYRVTVDTPEDFNMVKILIETGADKLSYKEIIKLLDQHPEWVSINAMVEQKKLTTGT